MSGWPIYAVAMNEDAIRDHHVMKALLDSGSQIPPEFLRPDFQQDMGFTEEIKRVLREARG